MALCLHHIQYSTAENERGGLIVPLFLPLIYEDTIEQLPSYSSVFFLSSISPMTQSSKQKYEAGFVCTDEGSLQQNLKEMKRHI